MNKDQKFQNIKGKLADILQLAKQMENTDIKQIDIDLLRTKLADTYDEVLSLTPKKASKVVIKEKSETQNEEVVPVVETKESIENIHEVKKENVAKTKLQVELDLDFNVEEDEGNTTEAKTKPYVPEIDLVRENESERHAKKTIGESFQRGKTLNDLVSEIKKEKDADVGLNFLKINNLTHAISINDKIEFVRELFNNNSNKYAEIISKINAQNDLDSAIYILSEVDFDNDKPAAKKLLNLVYRRFMDKSI